MIVTPSDDWIADSMRWRGKVLTGVYAHWCPEWDYLPIDETTPEWPCPCSASDHARGPMVEGDLREGSDMTPLKLLNDAIDPAHAMLAKHGVPSDDRARVLSLAIAGQESAWKYRVQVGGPAHSFWQFERGGGVAGVLSHPASRDKIAAVCAELDVPCDKDSVYHQMVDNDVLAAAMARLLLWTDPHALPAIDDVEGGWSYYLNNWRPGLPHHETWAVRHDVARRTVAGETV